MQKVRFINSKGESIYFDIQPPFVLNTIQGVGGVGANISSQKSPYQDGATYINSKLEVRDIFMGVTLVNPNSQQLFAMRNDIQRVFNPRLGEGYLIYESPMGTKMIRVVADGSPSFGELQSQTVKCQINLVAHNPLWTDLAVLPSSTNISNYIEKYEDMPIKPYFSANITKVGTSVINNGTFNSSMVVEVSGETTENVIVTNVTTGESFEIIRSIPVGSKLYVNTGFGKERVVKLITQNGTELNGFPYLSFHSEFIQLEVGENILSYDSAQDAQVNVIWHNCYIGL